MDGDGCRDIDEDLDDDGDSIPDDTDNCQFTPNHPKTILKAME